MRLAMTLAAAVLAGCSSSGSTSSKETDSGRKTEVAGVACAADANAVDLPSGFPADFPFPPGTVLTKIDDQGSAGVVVSGVTATPFAGTLKSLQTQLPAKGYTPDAGEVEPRDAESDWTSATYNGRWTIRVIPQCGEDVAVTVLARTKK